MKFKIVSIIIISIFCFTSLTKAASWSRWSVDGLTPSGSVYVYTNNVTSITIHVVCTRALGETGFSLPFAVGSTNDANGTVNYYSTFNITAADFDNYNLGGVLLDYTKVITIDTRTQSLGDGRFTLYDNTYNPPRIIYTPSFPFTYIPNQGTYDKFPSWYSNTLFNYGPSASNLNGTVINVSNTAPVLVVGQSIYSPNGSKRLALQVDGNLVLYSKNSSGIETAIWASNTVGKASASLYLQTDGNLVIYPGTNTPANHTPNSGLWASNIDANGLGTVKYAYYCLQNDGNLVFYWPNYDSYHGLVCIIAAASDSQSGPSAHFGNLNHPLWSPAQQQEYGSTYTSTAL